MTTSEPMSDKRLKEMLLAAANACGGPRELPLDLMVKITTIQAWQLAYAALTLAPEIERLRAALEEARGDAAFLEHSRDTAAGKAAAAMEIVRAVADAGEDWDYGGNSWLLFAGMHGAEKVREQARALLAPTEGASEGEPQP